MREDLLHFIWKYKKMQLEDLATTTGQPIQILEVGTHNLLAGPDFFNGKARIDGQLWAGNIEMHVKSSDWYAHRHDEDDQYANVILHVVWEDDTAIFRKDGSMLPALSLKDYIAAPVLEGYRKLFVNSQKQFINCGNDIVKTNRFVLENWFERLYLERLEDKSAFIAGLLENSNHDWEQVLFTLLFKNFGSKVNSDTFFEVAKVLPFSIVRKTQLNGQQLESLFFGMAGLIPPKPYLDAYHEMMDMEFSYLKTKFGLPGPVFGPIHFFKLRPSNFPTIRLSQLANLYQRHQNLFMALMEANNISTIYALFEATASSYWNTHYTFGKQSKHATKKLTPAFVDLLLINTVLPLKFYHAKHMGKDVNEDILALVSSLSPEKNSINDRFALLGITQENAMRSQALLQLHNNYCIRHRCLECAVGNALLKGNV